MSKIKDNYPEHKRVRAKKILEKQEKIDKKNSDDRVKSLNEADKERQAGIEARKNSNKKPAKGKAKAKK